MSQETSNNQEVLDNINNSLEEEVEVTGEHEEHEHTLFAENLFSIGNFNITNSLLTSWVAVFLIIILAIVIRIKNSKIPSRFQSFIETVIEGAYNMMDMVTDNRSKSERIFPIIFSVFIFVLINNWLGLFQDLVP
ncbi:MAG: F0F1 ATP synthase subunit A [Patescibacteria group bacterium]